MKKTYFIVTTVLLCLAIGCKKNKTENATVLDENTKGVVEVKASGYSTYYAVYVVGANPNSSSATDALCKALTFTASSSLGGPTEYTFYYWPDKTAKELGYESKDETNTTGASPYFPDAAPEYINNSGAKTYGANGYFAGNSCGGGGGNTVLNRYTKGVVEVRITATLASNTTISYEAYPVGQNYSLVGPCSYGEKTYTSAAFPSVDVIRYFYWPNKTVLDLGYSSGSSYGFSKTLVYGLVASMDDSCFTTGGNGSNPGTNGYFNGHVGDCH
jgi:hypothetical protein